MMKTITNVLSALLVLLAIIGLINHGAFGMNLNPLHDVLLLIAGGIGLYFGIMGTEFQARYFMRTIGVIFAIAGVIGLFAGAGTVTIESLAGRDSSHLLKLLPKHLEFGMADTITNLIVGAVALIAGFFPREKEIQVDMAAQKARWAKPGSTAEFSDATVTTVASVFYISTLLWMSLAASTIGVRSGLRSK
jgi:hypothetical protein